MIPSRSTLMAERLIVWVAVIVITWFIGYDVGRYTMKNELKEACVAPKQMVFKNVKHKKNFINYWSTK